MTKVEVNRIRQIIEESEKRNAEPKPELKVPVRSEGSEFTERADKISQTSFPSFYSMITGESVKAGQKVKCRLHNDGQNPNLHIYEDHGTCFSVKCPAYLVRLDPVEFVHLWKFPREPHRWKALKECERILGIIPTRAQYEIKRAHEKVLPTVFTFEDMATGKAEIAEEEFIIADILPCGGLELIAGPPGLYKSILGMMIAYHMTTGTPLLGEFEIDKPHRVLLIQEEMTAGTMAKRARLMSRGLADAPACGDRFLIINRSGFQLPKDQGMLLELIQKYRIEVCILDTLMDFSGPLDEDKASQMQHFFESLKQISLVTGVAFIGVHHTRKTEHGKKLTLDSIRGTMLYGAKADTVMLLDYGDSASYAKLRFPKARHAQLNDMLLWFDEERLWLEVSTSQRKGKIEIKDIVAILKDKDDPYPRELLISDLKKITGVGARTIIEKIKEALSQGKIVRFPLGGKGNPIGYLTSENARNYDQGQLM